MKDKFINYILEVKDGVLYSILGIIIATILVILYHIIKYKTIERIDWKIIALAFIIQLLFYL